jgi:hypothetical protein
LAVVLTFWSPWYPPGFTTGQWRFWLGLITVIALAFMFVIYFLSERRAHRGSAAPAATTESPPVVAGGSE